MAHVVDEINVEREFEFERVANRFDLVDHVVIELTVNIMTRSCGRVEESPEVKQQQ
jgi:hypothetical protein